MNRDNFGLPLELRNEFERERVRPIADAARANRPKECQCEASIAARNLEPVQLLINSEWARNLACQLKR